MHAGRFANATTYLGAPQGWDRAKQGCCGPLAVRAEKTTAGDAMTSAWYPSSQEELARIMAGAPIYLTIVGNSHPPVAMSVGPAPE